MVYSFVFLPRGAEFRPTATVLQMGVDRHFIKRSDAMGCRAALFAA